VIAEADKGIMPDFTRRLPRVHFTTALNILQTMGVDLNRINILADGEYENYRGFIHEQKPEPGSMLNPNTEITLHIGHVSAVDIMPFQFFYGLQNRSGGGTKWEDNARFFMAPFDSEVITHDAISQFEILKSICNSIDRQRLQKFLDLFAFSDDDGHVDFDEAVIWSLILPGFNQWAGNAESVEKILTCLVGYPVSVTENVAGEFEIVAEAQYRLGDGQAGLGTHTLLGSTFSDYDSTYLVNIANVSRRDIRKFLPGGKLRRKMEWLLKECMPNNIDYRIKVELAKKKTRLGGDGKSYLGYAVYA